MNTKKPTLGIIGGTGKLGAALARRWARAGYTIMLGSRDETKARETATALQKDVGGEFQPGSNAAAAASAEIVIVTVPFAAQLDTLNDIRAAVSGKLVVDTTVPLVPPKVMRVQMPPEGSAAMRAQNALGEGVTVVSAFHNVAAHRLATDDKIECDILVFGDSREARERVVRLVQDLGLRGIHGGVLANSVAAESLTSVLISINKAYSVDGAGIRITGSFEA